MDFEEAEKLLKDNYYSAYSNHDLLFSMSCIFEEEDADIEIVFAVPADFLQSWMMHERGKYWSFEDIQKWLQERYTSDDSSDILEKAALQNKVAFYFVDYREEIPF